MTVNVITPVAWDEQEERYYVLSCSARRQAVTANDIIAARRRYSVLESRGLAIIVSNVSVHDDLTIIMVHAGISSVIGLTYDLNGCTLRAVRDYLSEPEHYQSQEY